MASSFLLISSSLVILLSFLFPAAAGQLFSGQSPGDGVRIESISRDLGEMLAGRAFELVNAESSETYEKNKNYYSHDVPVLEYKMTDGKLVSAVVVYRNKAGELETAFVLTMKVKVGDHGGSRLIQAVLRYTDDGLLIKPAKWLYFDSTLGKAGEPSVKWGIFGLKALRYLSLDHSKVYPSLKVIISSPYFLQILPHVHRNSAIYRVPQLINLTQPIINGTLHQEIWEKEWETCGTRNALNVKVKKFNQARVNGGSNYDFLKEIAAWTVLLLLPLWLVVRFRKWQLPDAQLLYSILLARSLLRSDVSVIVRNRRLQDAELPSSIFLDALEHFASIDLLELCNEAKIERCRATRDLSSCGRYVQDVLNSCGHASLCAECSKRCDMCPICRTSVPNTGNILRPRLYYECVNAGLISKRYADRFQEKDDSRDHFVAIQRVYSLFDVAHGLEEMKLNLTFLQKLASQLTGISNVLEVMVSSLKENFSAEANDLHCFSDGTLKTKQHLETMIWCIQHDFLKNVQSRYPDYQSWILDVHRRKSARTNQTWPDISNYSEKTDGPSECTLFIELALSNLGIEESYVDRSHEIDISCLQDSNSPLIFSSKISESYRNRASACYPFENARAAADILFLHGSSDMVIAKRAIFLYYLFDRHWTLPDADWRYLVDDFASSFGISILSQLESFVFYLLDDESEQALQEACSLLPEIAGPHTHPKIAQVLLERQCPDVALTVLRCTGRDGFGMQANFEHENEQISLDEAVTVLRVRIECGLLTEAFMYQRIYCSNLKELISRNQHLSSSNNHKHDLWIHHMEVLVTELCFLCIRRNLVDRMIELPWYSTEEKFIHKYLLRYASENPSSIYGSLLMVYYLQRYRYKEAFQVDRELRSLEQSCLENLDEEIAYQMKSISLWRSRLVDKCLDLVPEVQRKQVLTGDVGESESSFFLDSHMDAESPSMVQLNPSNLSSLSMKPPSVVLQNHADSFQFLKTSNESEQNSSTGNVQWNFSTKVPSVLQERLLTSFGNSQNGYQVLPLKELNTSPLRKPSLEHQLYQINDTYARRSYGSIRRGENSYIHSTRLTSGDRMELLNVPSNHNSLKGEVHDWSHRTLGRQNMLDDPWTSTTIDEKTEKAWRLVI
ncbi:E3 ubiquitin-protein ligase HOS1 [Apostasia shenzhenica]|uniref:E3 ubiquitin-protein ligase HOS1 n=1 Tax=Apostasia shenzhenica TaxID=1088818 RepID=A0A2I0BEV3_9ASPA|nr:E3 ubiquitin-protein ligase HOS1 [Apostasia shenzhenica]